MNAAWVADWENINLVLWNDWTAPDGSEWILRLLGAQTSLYPFAPLQCDANRRADNQPNLLNYSFTLGGNIPLNNGSRFHLEVIQTDPASGNETSNLIDSESFNIVPGTSSAAATATITDIVHQTNAAGSTFLSTHTSISTAVGSAASATATGKEKSQDNQSAKATALQ